MLAHSFDSASKLALTNRWLIGTKANAADLQRREPVSWLAARHQWYPRPYHSHFPANNTQNCYACVRSTYERIPSYNIVPPLSLCNLFWSSPTVAFVLLGDKVMRPPPRHTQTQSTGNLAILDQHNEWDVLMIILQIHGFGTHARQYVPYAARKWVPTQTAT